MKNTTYDVFMSPAVSTYESPESMHNMRPSAVDTRNTSAKNTAARYTDRYSDCKTKERALLWYDMYNIQSESNSPSP